MYFLRRFLRPFVTQFVQGLVRWVARSILENPIAAFGRERADSISSCGTVRSCTSEDWEDLQRCQSPVLYARPPTPNPLADYSFQNEDCYIDKGFRPIN